MSVPFNRPFMTGRELRYIEQAHARGHLSGDGVFTKQCHGWLEETVGTPKALLTHSCTGALEMAAILADVGPGDEVIMPSYTFVSTANAFVLRGATPVFVDIRPDTLNIDESRVEEAISSRTKAIVPVHYAGVGCDMDAIMDVAQRHKVLVIEDAAQGIMSSFRGRPLGSIGHLGALSFHETKNIVAGEGGALLVNDVKFAERAEVVREKGTNRSQFFRGHVDKYTWCDIGSSYLPSELIAAFLWAQMEEAESITARRMALWNAYHDAFLELEQEGRLCRPTVPTHCTHNAHMYYLLLPNGHARDALIHILGENEITAVFHYVPLHLSPFGKKMGKMEGTLENTISAADRLVRLPLWLGLESEQERVINTIIATVRSIT